MASTTRMQFIIDGRDNLSRAFERAGDSANRLHRRLSAATTNSSTAINRFTTQTGTRLSQFQRDTDLGAKAAEGLAATLISLAPAAIPAAASLAPLAAGAGAVAVATVAFTAALIPQISALSEASEAEKKYDDAVAKSGRTSQEAVSAQLEYQRAMADLPPETRKAAAALGILKDTHEEWSNSLASSTMPAFTKSLAVANALLPKTEGLVRGTGVQLDRMVTVVAGGMESPGFDRLNAKFSVFATDTLRRVNDRLIHLMRTADSAQVGGGLSEFMDYARAAGPVVADTLTNVGTALMHIVTAGADVGVSMLDVVNALSGIVAAVPPGAIATVLQLALAIKAVRLAAVGMAAGRTALAAFGAQLLAMQTAAAATPGRLNAVTAAIGTMGRGAKMALAGTGVGLLVLAITELSQIGRTAPPDVDKLAVSLAKLAQTGKVSGEAARAYGTDLDGLVASLNTLLSPSTGEKVDQWVSRNLKIDSNPLKESKQDVEALDQSLASLVSSGKGDLAATVLGRIQTEMAAAGHSTDGLKGKLTEYEAALADQAFEQQLAAQSMGLFGAQAQEVQAKLDAQKQSTDGLRQSIMALNEVNRAALDGRAGMEAAIDAVAEATKDHATALRISNGELNLNSEKARTAQAALNDLARKTEENVSSARNSGKSWEYAKGQYDRGRSALISAADAMGLNRAEARRLADQILKTPNKTAYLKGNLEDLRAKLADAKARLAKAPSSKTAAIRGEISDLKRKIAQAKTELAGVRDKTVSVMVQYRSNKNPSDFAKSIGGYASGGRPKPGEIAWVGEDGPELVRFGRGVEVIDHRTSMAMVADAVAAARPLAAPGRAAVMAPTSRPAEQAAQAVTYNVYPRSSVIDVQDLRLIQRQEEARQRVGRPR